MQESFLTVEFHGAVRDGLVGRGTEVLFLQG
jgi:hypothetical protein